MQPILDEWDVCKQGPIRRGQESFPHCQPLVFTGGLSNWDVLLGDVLRYQSRKLYWMSYKKLQKPAKGT